MKALYDVLAPAKLNLFLHILGRRDDGYHLLQSAFVLIDWCDTLHFEIRPGGGISREDLGTPLPVHDLIVRAAEALQATTGTQLGVHIAVQKRIPAQAGMGGGSSDAASTLLALNRLWRLNLSIEQLSHIGLTLGADVPFFLLGSHAWVEGIGEKLTPVELPPMRFVVVKPAEGLNTAKIFSSPQLKRDSETAIILGFAANPIDFGHNDLQEVAEELCPAVKQARIWLESRGLKARMTGSGSAVFAPLMALPVDRSGVHLSQSLQRLAWQDTDLQGAPDACEIRFCQSLSCHPLQGWASAMEQR
jgi:4-diphosphocytidyl-2-C-methyl-D-erythritol kinase